MPEKINVLIAASEISPLAQTGGLADVTGSLPKALHKLGLSVSLIMPAYQEALAAGKFKDMGLELTVAQAGENIVGRLLRGELAPGIPVYLVRCDRFFDRPGLYGDQGVEHPDNPERFAFFSKAVIKALPHLGGRPDILMANDWQTGLIMPLLKEAGADLPKGVFAIHNQGYLGLVPPDRRNVLGLPDNYYTLEGMEYYGQVSLLKAGIVYSQAVVTVSPTYAKEVRTPEGGNGLDGVMRRHANKLYGLLNGVDYQVWNPEDDPLIAAHYSRDDLAGKAGCKAALLREFGLESLKDRPVAGMVSRLTAQKGLSLVAEGAEDMFRLGLGLVVLGSGEKWHEDLMSGLAERFPEQCRLVLGYDGPMSHRIIAGCDMILVPSMYEPCGLVQLYALRYGSIPIVRAVGGLNDTVRDFAGASPDGQWDTGFKFTQFQAGAMVRAVRRAVELYQDPAGFTAMIRAAMGEDFSWEHSARAYVGLFEKLVR